jgi:hypothetical protein
MLSTKAGMCQRAAAICSLSKRLPLPLHRPLQHGQQELFLFLSLKILVENVVFLIGLKVYCQPFTLISAFTKNRAPCLKRSGLYTDYSFDKQLLWRNKESKSMSKCQWTSRHGYKTVEVTAGLPLLQVRFCQCERPPHQF